MSRLLGLLSIEVCLSQGHLRVVGGLGVCLIVSNLLQAEVVKPVFGSSGHFGNPCEVTLFLCSFEGRVDLDLSGNRSGVLARGGIAWVGRCSKGLSPTAAGGIARVGRGIKGLGCSMAAAGCCC